MKRVYSRLGDVFEAKLNSRAKKYFQYIANDPWMLNSDVIRIFKRRYPIKAEPDLQDVVLGEVEFHAHVVVNWGLKQKLWRRVGNAKSLSLGDLNSVYFRGSEDSGPLAKPFRRWTVWKVSGKRRYFVEKKTKRYKEAEPGLVVNPNDILIRIKTGKYRFFIPAF